MDENVELTAQEVALLVLPSNENEQSLFRFFSRDQRPQQRQLQQQRIQPASIRLLNRAIDIITLGFFPIVFTRVLKRLLSASTFSEDMMTDILRFYYGSEGDITLIDRFHQVVIREMPFLSERWSKLMAILIHLIYSVGMSSYMIFSMSFFSLCLVLTMTRKYEEVSRFLYTVVRNRNDVF